jgi:hypothetical protein
VVAEILPKRVLAGERTIRPLFGFLAFEQTNRDLEGFYEKGIDSAGTLRIGERESIRLRSQYRSSPRQPSGSLDIGM